MTGVTYTVHVQHCFDICSRDSVNCSTLQCGTFAHTIPEDEV